MALAKASIDGNLVAADEVALTSLWRLVRSGCNDFLNRRCW
jgi:hypothetical protein